MNTVSNYPSIEQMVSRIGYTENRPREIKKEDTTTESLFSEILKSKTEFSDTLNNQQVMFSRHATERMASRNIELTENQLERLNQAKSIAQDKGIKESLVMLDEYAFIVNVKNNTVVTAVSEQERNVFTNIDGAVII